MKNFCVVLVKLYRKYISPLKPPCCRFYPTCSEYALQAFNKHGFFGGLILSVWRILRCNPLCKAGYDPVPEKIKIREIFDFKFFNKINKRGQTVNK